MRLRLRSCGLASSALGVQCSSEMRDLALGFGVGVSVQSFGVGVSVQSFGVGVSVQSFPASS